MGEKSSNSRQIILSFDTKVQPIKEKIDILDLIRIENFYYVKKISLGEWKDKLQTRKKNICRPLSDKELISSMWRVLKNQQ